jgi:hypothetical protein
MLTGDALFNEEDEKTPSVRMRVCIESPLSGDVARNVLYADAAMLDSLLRDEAPFLGHLLYPRVLNDAYPEDRARGIRGHLAWLRVSDCVALYVDLGISNGMKEAIVLAGELRLPVVERKLGYGWMESISYRRPTKGFL